MQKIDLRSDTVTKPSPEMREAIFSAEVGDDVMREDPTVNQLEAYSADLLGMESGLFVPTGTQGNLISILSHCQRGEEYIAGTLSHLYRWEAGGSSVLGGVTPQPIDFEKDGTLNLEKVKKAIKPNDYHFAKTKLLALENTQGGKPIPLEYMEKASSFAKENSLSLHLDGARLFNAAIACCVPVKEISKYFDSVTFCLSKGLGAPAGSVICGNKSFIERARRWRKMLGGGMRQSGILASAGLYALKNNVARLSEDHKNAEKLGQGLSRIPFLENKVKVHTNMVYVDVGNLGLGALAPFLASRGVLILPAEVLRLVTHLDISEKDVDIILKSFEEFYSSNEVFEKSAEFQSVY